MESSSEQLSVSTPVPAAWRPVPRRDEEAGDGRGPQEPLVMSRTLSELRQAEEIMSRHVGPTHVIRVEIGRMIANFEHLLGL